MLEVMRKMKLQHESREKAKQAKAMQKQKLQQRKLAQQKLAQQKLAQQKKAKLAQQRKEQKEQHVQILSRRPRGNTPAVSHTATHGARMIPPNTKAEKRIVSLASAPSVALGTVLLKGLKLSVPQVQALVHSGSVRVNDHITTAGDETSLLKGTETILVSMPVRREVKDRGKTGISAFKLAQQSAPPPGPSGPVELLCKRLRSVRRHWLIAHAN